MPEPVFSAEDRVDQDALPPELKGKTPKQIVDYFAERERLLREQNRPPLPAKAVAEEEKIDLFGPDASGSIKREIDRKVNEGISRTTAVAIPALIAAARTTCRDNHKDFDKFAADIEKFISPMTPENQMNPQFWEIAYLTAKGTKADQMVTEAIDRTKQEHAVSERPTARQNEEIKPKELSVSERTVAEKLGMTAEHYSKAAQRYEAEDGRLPLTLDSAKPRKKAS